MVTHYRKIGLIFAVLVLAGLTACSNRTEVKSDLGIKGAPDWVNEGYQALDNRDGRLFHGVGSAPKMADQSLQRSAADNRARAEVARTLSSFMNIVAQDYSAASGDGPAAYNEQAISRQIDNITHLNMSGVEIIGRWKDPRTGTVYSLAELDMKRVKDVVAGARQMNDGFRQYIQANADNVFDRIAHGGGQ
ncbi:MAG: hypothetical protein PVJ40_09455 [Gammaproteobacteria bacterium]|jgi:hypothetical protein